MIQKLYVFIEKALHKHVPATGLGLFRIAFGLIMLQEIGHMLYFSPLIFDPVPFIDSPAPLIPVCLVLWGLTNICLSLGLHTRRAAIANYFFWIVFRVFTPIWQDFDGGFDHLMVGSSLLLIFIPSNTAISLDNLREKLQQGFFHTISLQRKTAPQLYYWAFVFLSLGLLYFDSLFHKLQVEFWRNGLGAWLPSSMPYYMSPVDMSFLLELPTVQMGIGYSILIFELVFVFLFIYKRFRPILFWIGIALHLGIVVSLNIYPFGIGMLIHYLLLAPLCWWKCVADRLRAPAPALRVYYDRDCPLCNRTVIVLAHFDVFRRIEFLGLQQHARQEPALAQIPEHLLLRDLYAVDRHAHLYNGLETYILILLNMGYLAPIAWLLRLPGIHQLADRIYRRIADSRVRIACDAECPTVDADTVSAAAEPASDQQKWLRLQTIRWSRAFIVVLGLQLNCTVHYGVLEPLIHTASKSASENPLKLFSDIVILISHTFAGISPHSLYVHQFDDYNHIFAFTYHDKNGHEQWLPFVNREGRLIAPNWGRVQSMWANISVTGHINIPRFTHAVEKITAFWATKAGLNLDDTTLSLMMKPVQVPSSWVPQLRRDNLVDNWQEVGKVIWKDRVMQLDIHGPRLDTL
jgi:predicted DCC family thiol-disulfide oxidoreductase YuxK